MTDDTVIDRIWTIADRMDPCILITSEGKTQQARPVFARVRRNRGAIFILTDTQGSKLDLIAKNPNVTLAFSDERANEYVVINGKAMVHQDPDLARELWRFSGQTFFNSPENPELRVVEVRPDAAELWDGSNILITGAKILAERLFGAKVELVKNAQVTDLS